MGSLVPGWDANLGTPKDLVPDDVDVDNEPEPEGYFARLRSHSHGECGEQETSPSLGRASAPLTMARSATMQSKLPSHMERSSTITHIGTQAAVSSTRQAGQYRATDWAEELTTLRSASLNRSSLGGHHEEAHPGGGKQPSRDHEAQGTAWWRALEVGHLNEVPDVTPNGNTHSTFVPQLVPHLLPHQEFDSRNAGGEAGAAK